MHRPAPWRADEEDSLERSVLQREAERSTGTDGRFRIALRDLIPGSSDEVVLFNDSAVREVVLETRETPVAEGEVARHVTADGIEVSGFRYVRFADGLTLFYDPATDLRLDVDTAATERVT